MRVDREGTGEWGWGTGLAVTGLTSVKKRRKKGVLSRRSQSVTQL